jgi:thiosulfate/3-mercaptopyruvate sulfurtransferase
MEMTIRRFVLALAAMVLASPAFAQAAAPAQGRATPPAGGATPLLVDAAWLSQHLNDRNLVILHVDDEAEYKAGHIPGARFITMQHVAVQGPLTLELPAPGDLRTRLQALGISDDSRIVVYVGRNGAFPSATRVILTLDHAGLGDQTALLNGGVAAWTRAGQTLTAALPTVTPGRLTARPTKPVVVDAEFVKTVGQKPAHTLVDGRAGVFYTGVSATYGNSGHIPGAVNIPFTQIIDSELMVDRARIEGLFRAAGVKPGDTVVAYCHIGQQGTAVVFGARLLGHPVVLYDGSMQDWATNSRGPVVK